MPSSFQHEPALTVAASNTTAGAAVKWVAAKNIGESLIILDSGGNGRIGLAGDLDLITLTANTVTVAGTVAATTLTGAGAGITALAAANITASGTLPALNGAALTALNGTQVTSGTLPAARIAADSIVEAKLDVSNGPTNGQFLQAQSGEGGGLTWAAAGGDLSFGGDTFGADKVIGSNDAYALSFETAGVVRMKIEGAEGGAGYTAAGSITMPTQPCVSAINTLTDASVTGDGESPTVDFNSELFDQGGDFASDIFTAPVTGRYSITAEVGLFNLSTSHDAASLKMVETDRTWEYDWGNVGEYKDANGSIHYGATAIVDMDAGNTMRIQVRVNFGATSVGVTGNSAPKTWFSAMLVA